MAHFLRKSPYQVNMLLGGVDADDKVPSLYWLDYMGTLQKLDYSAAGYASNFVLSTLDCHWKPDMTVEEGLELMKKCIAELHVRFMINQPKFLIKLVTAEGIKVIEIPE